MAVTFDATASKGTVTAGTVQSWTHPGSSGPNYLATVGVSWFDAISITISSVTFGGQAMTLIKSDIGQPSIRSSLYGIINPPTGSQTVSVTLSAQPGFFQAGSITYIGADQTTGWHNATSIVDGGFATSHDLVITSAIGEMTVTNFTNDGGGSIATNQTLRWSFAAGISGAGDTGVGAATVTHTWSSSNANDWAIVGASIIAAPPLPIGLPSSMTVPIISVQSW